MSDSKIRRKNKTFPFTLSTATAVANTLPMGDMAGGIIEVGTMLTAATQINIWVADVEAGPFYQLHDKDGAVVKITMSASTTDGKAYSMPEETYGSSFVKFVMATTAGTGVSGTAMFKG